MMWLIKSCGAAVGRRVPLALACAVLSFPAVTIGADVPEALRDRLHQEPDRQAVDSIDFLLSLSLSSAQARAILPVCEEACRLYLDGYDTRAEIQPLEIEAYSAFLAEDRLNQGFSPEVERRTAQVHHRAIVSRETVTADLNALADEVWEILTPSQRHVAENYKSSKEAVFAAFASPRERRKAAKLRRRAAKEERQSFRRAAQRGALPASWRPPEDPRLISAREELEALRRATHPRPDKIAKYLLTPAAAEPLYAWTGADAPRVVREAVHCWRFGTQQYPRARCERDKQLLRELRKEINNWNLVNGMYFSREQIEQLVYLAHETERLKTAQRLAQPKRKMTPGQFNATRVYLEQAAEAVLRPGQRDVLSTYKPCLIPPKNLKDPVRVGQADDNTQTARWLERARRRSEAQLEVMIDRLIDRERARLGPMDAAAVTARRDLLWYTARQAAEMTDVEFAVAKDELADLIKPRDRKQELIGEIDALRRDGFKPGRISQFLLNHDFARVLMERYGQLAKGVPTTKADLTQGPRAVDCQKGCAVRREKTRQEQQNERP